MDNFNNNQNYNNYNNPDYYNPNYNPTQNNYQNSDGRLNYPSSTNNIPIQSKAQPKKGWSWGASMLGILWGFGNHTYMPLLGLIPFLNFIWWIICGVKGYEWALESGHFKTVEEFNAVQDSWDRAGKVYLIITLVILAIYFIFFFLIFGATFAGLMAGLSEYAY